MRPITSGDGKSGVRLALFEEGDAANPTIVLVHGYPDTHAVWDEVAALLRDRFHVVRYDVRGAGASTAPRDRRAYGFDELTADLAAVLDAVGKPEVHLVGHDWGAIQCWEALARPGLRERIATFTTLGVPGYRQIARFMSDGKRRHVLGQRARSWYIGLFRLPVLPELGWRVLAERLRTGRSELGPGVPPRLGHPAETLARDARNGLQLYRVNDAGQWRDAEARVDAPVQLIEGTRDPYVSPHLLASLGRWVPELAHRKIVAGHWMQRTHPGQVARMIAEFAGRDRPTRELRRAADRRPFRHTLVVVTGAGSGIGRATARAFAAHGAEVICADLDLKAAEETAGSFGGVPYEVDVADAGQMAAFAEWVADQHGVPDVVVNNAGVAVSGPFLEHSLGDWQRVLDVNLWGVIHGCRLFARQMVERGEGGHIVNVASVAAFLPSRSLPAYSVSKAAVKSLSDCLRAELAGHGIGVSTICPGFVSTAIARNATFVGPDVREAAITALERRAYPPERVAAHILRAVHRNQALVPVNAEGRLGYVLSRLSPAATRAVARVLRNPAIDG
ncbi:SDR family oxidoreductase [Nonomuraea sp. NPDC050328]|uniref:SDR family oxidoreductase n=1 Tax=Nonomuraea sp. NPDC050328 TaxID=3364361 RepID=UPI0037B05C41